MLVAGGYDRRDLGSNLTTAALGFPKPKNTSCNQFGKALYVLPPEFIKSRIVSKIAIECTHSSYIAYIHSYIYNGSTFKIIFLRAPSDNEVHGLIAVATLLIM